MLEESDSTYELSRATQTPKDGEEGYMVTVTHAEDDRDWENRDTIRVRTTTSMQVSGARARSTSRGRGA